MADARVAAIDANGLAAEPDQNWPAPPPWDDRQSWIEQSDKGVSAIHSSGSSIHRAKRTNVGRVAIGPPPNQDDGPISGSA